MENRDEYSLRASPDGEPPSKRRRTSNFSAHLPREVGLMRSLPGDSSFVGSASGIYFIRSVYGSIRHSQPSTATQIHTPNSDIIPGEDDHLPSADTGSLRHPWGDHEVTTHHPSRYSFEDLVQWSASYFAHWHLAYPFLHAPAILGYFEQISRDGIPVNNPEQDWDFIILRAIISISLADRRQDPSSTEAPYPSELVFKSYDAATDSLQKALSKPVPIKSLQAAMSVQLFLVSMLRMNAASRLGGLIIRMALQLGLHRCPHRFPSFSSSERELRQRIFWSLYCIDRTVCQSMGLPLSLRDDDIDVCYPGEERHLGRREPADSRLRLVEFLARQFEIRGQIMELRNKSIQHSQKETDQAVVITAKLARWWNDVEEFIDANVEEPLALSPYHRTVLTILYHEAVISLNRPILATSSEGSAYNAALQHCIGSSRSIISTLHNATKPAQTTNQPEALALMWPSFTWAVWMSTFILFHAAHNKHVSQHMVSRLANRSLDILQNLSTRCSVWPEACAAAIRDLCIQILPSSTPLAQEMRAEPISGPNGHQTPSSHTPSTPRPVTSRYRPNTDNSTPSTNPHHSLRRVDPHQGPNSAQALNQPPGSATNHSVETGLGDGWVPDSSQPRHGNTQSTERLNMDPIGFPNAAFPPNPSFNYLQWGDGAHIHSALNQSIPLVADDGADPFAGFDIPFWIGQDQYSGMINEWR